MQSSVCTRVHLFDCDGVLLNSNNLKIDALRNALQAVTASKDFIDIACDNFRRNFGISRNKHFQDFESIKTDSFSLSKSLSREALSLYSDNVMSLYRKCSKIKATQSYISKLPESEKIYVVSASDQEELRTILPMHFPNILTSNIFGGPASKIDNISSILKTIKYEEAILYGDSIHDAQAAKIHNIKFYGLYEYAADSEALSKFCKNNSMDLYKNCMHISV